MRIQIVLYNGFDELDAIGPFEVLQNAHKPGADLQTTLVTLDGAKEVTAQNGLVVKTTAALDATYDAASQADIMLLPGGGWAARSTQGAWAEAQRGVLPAAIKQWYDAGKTLAAVCTGGMLLATGGLLRGRNAITHHSAMAELQDSGARVIQARVVDDGDIITAGGVTSGIDLALWLVERYCGSHIAVAVEQIMEYQRRGTVWRNNNRKESL